MEKVLSAARKGWNRNTDMGCNVKTILSSDMRMRTGKEYRGILRRDSDTVTDEFFCRDPHYTFIEAMPEATVRRNARLYNGRFITVTRWDDGSLHPNFKQVAMGPDFSVDSYVIAVMDELRQALTGLVEMSYK